MRYIVEIARRKSFTRAAENLYVSQGALSQQVRKIEETLETPLFIRNTRSIALTEAGEHFVRCAEKVLAAADRLDSEMEAYKKNRVIRIVSTPRMSALRFARVETVFSEKHPQISFRMDSLEESETASLAESADWDIAILRQPLLKPFRDGSRFYQELLFSFEWCLLVSPEHPLAGAESVRFEELGNETFFAGTEELVHIAKKERVLPATARLDKMSSSNYDIMSERVRSGKAVAVGIKPLADYYGLTAVPIRPRKLDKTYLVCPANRIDSLSVKELVGIFRSLTY